MRCFVAISPSDAVRAEIAAFAAECADAFPGKVKPVSASNLHLTLSFLGETAPDRFDGIFEALASVRFGAFCLEARTAGFFPDNGAPRILWAGTAPSEELRALNELCEKTVASLGFPRTSPGFVPHFTVGRVKGVAAAGLEEFMKKNAERRFGAFSADRFSFFVSDISGKDPVYTAVRDFRLL